MKTFKLLIISPEGQVFDDHVQSITAPGLMGSFGVWANHAPMIAALTKGILKVHDTKKEQFFLVDQGVFEVDNAANVVILVDAISVCSNYDDAVLKLKESGRS